MARRKKIKPIDHKYLLNKKRDNIRKSFDYCYLILIFACILICGLNQNNALIVGWGLILMGIVSLPAAVFHIYIIIKGWRVLFWYDDPEIGRYITRETKEQDLKADKIWQWVEAVFLILLTIGLPIEGILKLVEYTSK